MTDEYELVAGCTTQACAFRDGYADYTGVNYEVYCLSADTPAEQKAWKDKVRVLIPIRDVITDAVEHGCCVSSRDIAKVPLPSHLG